MSLIVSIVEGDGEVRALPILLRRLAEAKGSFDLSVPVPIRVHRDQFLNREDEFSRKLLLAGAKAGTLGLVLVLLDADDDCPVTLAAGIAARAVDVIPHRRLAVVIANREYEAWLLAGAASLAAKRGLPTDLQAPAAPDTVRDAKGWLRARVQGGRYHEVSDQPALTALFEIGTAATNSRSLRKLIDTVATVL